MVQYGATPVQALRYGTSAAAELLGLIGETGTLKSGKRADMVAVYGNPLENIEALRAVRMVVHDGESVFLGGV